MTHEQLHSDIAADIKRDGRSVLCIGAEEGAPAFAYTIGNALPGLPELLMIGSLQLAPFLNILSEKMIERRAAFNDGELVEHDVFVFKIINADNRAHSEYTVQAGQVLGHENYAVQQVLIPDRNGRYADDPECHLSHSIVPVLGTAYRH